MIENMVDIAAWSKRFPLDDFLPKMESLDSIQTPLDWAIVEQIRERSATCGSLGRSRPTDSLVFIRGDAPARNVTKIGGAPYRPADMAWPRREDGADMTFVAQFSFTESRDILGELPGDVLLIFARDDDLYIGDPPYFQFEWQPAGLAELIRPEDVPSPAWSIPSCYALRHRTVDFEDESIVAERADWVRAIACMHPARVRSMLHAISRLPSAKIGGLPHWFYSHHAGIERDGPILCALGDLLAGTDVVPPPPDVDWWSEQEDDAVQDDSECYLTWRDGFQMNFVLSKDGKVSWNVDFG